MTDDLASVGVLHRVAVHVVARAIDFLLDGYARLAR